MITREELRKLAELEVTPPTAINAAAKNPVLTATYQQVNARLQALRFRSNQDGEKWKRAVGEHETCFGLSRRDQYSRDAGRIVDDDFQ